MTLPFSGNANQIAYASSVASQLAQVWLYDPSFSLTQDPETPEKMLRDLVISGALDHLQRSIVGHGFSFEPKKDSSQGRDLAKVVELLTKEQRMFPQSLYNLSRATFRGATWGRIFSEKRTLAIGDDKLREWTVISKVKDVDKRRFRLVQDSSQSASSLLARGLSSAELAAAVEETPGLNSPLGGWDAGVLGTFRWEFWRGYGGPSQPGFWWSKLEEAAPLDRWICHVTDTSEQGMGYGYGLADELYAFFWLKGSFLRWAAQSAERYGQGFLVAKTRALRDFMAKGYSQPAALAATVQIMRTFRSENFAAVDELTDFQMIDMPGEGMRWIYEWVKYLDNGMRQRILAALQPTGSGDGSGGFSSAKVEEGSTDSMIAYLRSPLEETWTHTGSRFLVEHNEENLRELGLWGIGYPKLLLKGEDQRDIEQMLKVFDLAARLKIPVRLEDFYRIFRLTPPNEKFEAIDYPEVIPTGTTGSGLDNFSEPFDESSSDEGTPIGEGGTSVAEAPGIGGGRLGRNGGAA